MKKLGLILGISLFSLMSFPFLSSLAQDGPKKPKVAAKLDEAISRAIKKVKAEDRGFLTRLTLTSTDPSDLIFICEYSNGDVGLYQVAAQESDDAWIVMEKDKIELLEDAARRSRYLR